MNSMKCVKIFLLTSLLAFGCQKPEEKVRDLDEMVMDEGEWDASHLTEDPAATPQESLK